MPSQLFSSLALRELTLDNRIIISPMCQYSAEEGSASDWHMIHLGSLALSGAGMLIIEATAVEPIGRISPGCLGLWSDDNERALARVLGSVRKYSSIPIAMQLAHAGRKGSSRLPWLGGDQLPVDEGGWQTVAPSAVAQADEVPPVALTTEGIANIRDKFVAGVERALRLGVDALELHCAHGYLMHEFLSPLTNRRDDLYGGALENRMRLPLETFAAMRAAWPADKPLGVRISASDWIDGGWDIEQSVAFCKQLGELGCDWIDVSSGGLAPEQQIKLGPGYQVAFAERIKLETGLPTMAVGLITEPQQAEDLIAQGKADMVALARGMLWNPHWPYQAAGELGAQVSAPPQYLRAAPHQFKNAFRTPTG